MAGVLAATILPSQIAAATVSSSASDQFTRTVAKGWGTAPTGGAWSTSSSNKKVGFSVSSGHGVVSNLTRTVSATATLGQTTATDLDMSASIGMPTKAAALYTAFEMRTQSDGSRYRGRLSVGASGSSTLSVTRVVKKSETTIATVRVPFAVKPGAWVHLEYRLTGTSTVSILGRAWLAGSATPGWQLSTTDRSSTRITRAGHVGLWQYSGTGNKVALTTQFDGVGVTPVVTPTAPPTTSPVAPASQAAGAAPMGTTAYPVPSNALVVSTSGSDSASGSLKDPFRTIQEAVDAAASGQTIVVRAGTYNESVTVPLSKSLTIQSYPDEAVWLDGSKAVTSWARSGSTWTTPWSFFPSNVIDGIADNPRYVDPSAPLAARMDQAFYDGTQLTQVASASAVTTGTFYANPSARTITVGSDPSGHDVRVSNLSQAFYFNSPNSTLRGIGVRRYASTDDTWGAVRFTNQNSTIQNVDVEDSSWIGIQDSNNAGTIDHVTVKRSGLLGIGANANYGLSITNSVIDDNDSSHFKASPVSGGVKVTRSRGVTIRDNVFDGNISSGFWCDESCYDVTVTGNTFTDNAAAGISLELSQKAVIADNTITGSGSDILITDTGDVRIVNNSIGTAGLFSIQLKQDSRLVSDPSVPGHDPRQPNPDPTVPWVTKGVTIENTAFGTSGPGFQIYGLDMGGKDVTITGNMFNRRVSTSNATLVAWGTSATSSDYIHYQSPEALQAAQGPKWTNAQTDGAESLSQMASDLSQASGIATPLPSDIAALIGQKAGVKHIGAF